MTERQIDDVDAELAAVLRREHDRVDDVAGAAVARRIEYLQADERDVGGNPCPHAVAAGAAAADETGNVRPVAVVVERRPGMSTVREVIERLDLLIEVAAVGDTGVD